MTDKTRTERQLIDSIRQAKTGETQPDPVADRNASAAPAQPSTSTGASAKSNPNPSPNQTPETRTPQPSARSSGYQSRGRVWPD
jgi:hypothetical protein